VCLKASIITPSYNQGVFIEKTIESVLTQDYANIEYIVIDGGSTDNTLDILKKYDGRLKWISESDKGQSDAINKGFRMATGDIFAWLNSDDTYEPRAVSAAVSIFEKKTRLGLLYGEGYRIDENGVRLGRFPATTYFNLWKLIHVWDYILQPSTFFARSALESCGYLDENLRWTMDWDLWIKLALLPEYDVEYTEHFLANSREYAGTKTSVGGLNRVKEIRDIMLHHAGENYAEGFRLHYFDWITKLKLAGDEDITQKSIDFLNNLPIPDEEGYCPPETRFCTKKGLPEQILHLEYEDKDPLEVNIFVNDYFVKQVVFDKADEQRISLNLDEYSIDMPFHLVAVEYSRDIPKPKLRAFL